MSTINGFATEAEFKTNQLQQIRAYHADLIRDLGIMSTDFQMKMGFYTNNGKFNGKTVVGIFPSEFKRPNGLYFELIGRDYQPASPQRTVYRVPHNDHFESEYEMNDRGSFYVPLDELRTVNPASVAIAKSAAVTSSDKFTERKEETPTFFKPSPEVDAPYSEMTIRDYFAIKTGKPVSQKMWLNELIKNNR